MAEFPPKSQVQVSGIGAPRVSALANDLSTLFGAVTKGAEKFAQVGEQAAKLDFNARSADITAQILEFEKLAPDNMDNPDFWEGYTKSIDNSLQELMLHADNYKGNEASYNVYREYASDFAASIGLKYFPRNNGQQLEATNKRITTQVNDIISKLGRDITPKNIDSIDAMLSTVIKDPTERRATVYKSVYGSMFNAFDAGFDQLPPQVKQDYVTADDGSLDLNGVANLYNSLSANGLSKAIVEEGKLRVINASGNSADDEQSAKRLNMIYGYYRSPSKADNTAPNFEFQALQNSVDGAKPDYKNDPKAIMDSFVKQKAFISDFKKTKWFKILTDSEQKALFNMEDKLLQEEASYTTLTNYASKGLVPTFEGATALTYDYVNPLGKTVKGMTITTELISKWKSNLDAEASQKIFDSTIPVEEATKAMQVVVDKTGRLPDGVKALKEQIEIGATVSSLAQAKNKLRTMEVLVKSKHFPDTMMDSVNAGYDLIATAEQDPKKIQGVLNTLNQNFQRDASNARAKELSTTNFILKSVRERTKRSIGFDLKAGTGTAQQIANLTLNLGTNYSAMTDDEKAEFIKANTYETASGVASRSGWSNSYVVVKPKIIQDGSTSVMEEQIMVESLNGWVKAYNKNNGTAYDMDDFQFDSAPDGALMVKSKTGKILHSNLTGTKLLSFRDYYLKSDKKINYRSVKTKSVDKAVTATTTTNRGGIGSGVRKR